MTYPHTPGHCGGASELAARRFEGKALTIRETVKELAISAGRRGLTASEAFQDIQAGETSIRPRFSELFLQGVLIKLPRLRKNAKGNEEHVYIHVSHANREEIAESQRQALLAQRSFSMTPQEASRRVRSIESALPDAKVAASMEMDLYVEIIAAIANGECEKVKDTCLAALEAVALDFRRF